MNDDSPNRGQGNAPTGCGNSAVGAPAFGAMLYDKGSHIDQPLNCKFWRCSNPGFCLFAFKANPAARPARYLAKLEALRLCGLDSTVVCP